jgi:hypothetical protein
MPRRPAAGWPAIWTSAINRSADPARHAGRALVGADEGIGALP